MDDAETQRPRALRVHLSWERVGPRLQPQVTFDVDAEVVVAFTAADGRTLLAAVADEDGPPVVVSLWDPATGRRAGEPLTCPAEVVVAMVPAAPFLAVAYHDVDESFVQVWEPLTGERVGKPLPGPGDYGSGLAAVPMPDGRHLLAVIEETDGALRLWDPATGDLVAGPLAPQAWAVAAATAPDGRTLLLTLHGDEDEATVRSWDPATGEPRGRVLRTRHDEGNPARLAALPQPDGRLILAVSRGHEDDGFVTRFWDAATGRKIGDPVEGEDLLVADGRVPFVAAGDGLWDPGSGRRVGDSGTNSVPRPLAAVPGSPALLAGPGFDGTLWLWDPATVRPLTDAERMGPVTRLTPVTLPDGRALLAAETAGDVHFWDALTGEPAARPLTGHLRGVTAIASAPLPDGRAAVVTCDGAGAIRSWDPATGRVLAEVPAARSHVVRSMAPVVMPDGRTLLAVGNDVNVLRLRDPATGAAVGDMFTRLDRPPLRAVATVPMPDGRTLLAAGNATPARGGGFAARLWDPATGHPVGEPFADRIQVWSLAGHDSGLLAIGTGDGRVRVHDVTTREMFGELPGKHPCLFTAADGGPVLAVARRDEVQFWDPVAQRRLASRRMGTTVLALAATGSRLAVGCDGDLAVLDVTEWVA
ncbi:WD40 repeat domain-containing protein [Actinoplanes sp. HUAS TT8]|uniref:WD40 repeat domain-containing protein n=1 Tax=Actinoplanes sp. HUAS TT8 TaxID=3447453 RepID=UPI003F52261E